MGLSRAVNDGLVPGTEVFVAEMGTYGPKARDKAPKDRFAVLNKKAG